LAELRKVILVASQFFEFLHSLGHSATWSDSPATSVLLSTTDVDRTFYDISNLPIGDIGP